MKRTFLLSLRMEVDTDEFTDEEELREHLVESLDFEFECDDVDILEVELIEVLNEHDNG